MPDSNDGMKYYVRPHHVETLTNHFRSVKDDFLNTRYISHSNMSKEKTMEPRDTERAIELLERNLEKLKMNQQSMCYDQNLNQNYDEIREREQRWQENESHEVRVKVDNFFKKKEPSLGKGVLVEAFEAMNTVNRVQERDLLNKERESAYEKNRPPSKGWYELKGK
jgi:hypothetical protein